MRWHSIRTECLGGTSESDHVRGLANSMTRTSDGCGASKVEPLGLPHSKPWSLDEAAAIRAELRQRVQSLVIVQEAMLDSLKNLEKFDYASEGAFLKPTATFGGRSATKHMNQRVTRPRVPNSRAIIRGRDAVRRGATIEGGGQRRE